MRRHCISSNKYVLQKSFNSHVQRASFPAEKIKRSWEGEASSIPVLVLPVSEIN